MGRRRAPRTGGRLLPWFAGLLLPLLLAACGGSGSPEREVRVRVPPGAPFAVVADSLAERGVIRWPAGFRIYARITGADRSVRPGTYAFFPGESWSKILEDLRLGRILTTRIVIPEGWDLRRIGARLANVTGADPDSVTALLADSLAADRFGVPGPNLEGYLFPATYTLPVDMELDSIIAFMIAQHQSRWTEDRQARADSIGMGEREVVTLASIIEREAKDPDEMEIISGVFHNRLRIGLPLQADATVQYALGEHKARLLYGHIDAVADNPYNTYRHAGLPPGPIASPSTRAIDAALYPADVDYLYFVARPDGTHIFTRTLEEHNRARVVVRREWDALRQ